ncbi:MULTISPECIES: RsmB/NOP family class I SAM-dependent RNA methyltransferase [Arsenicicoccus]|uniref:RsmB/NOP family class I SAM-dependent RNA methyltransferase n=1 Tax=Arsenicicoccus TaxID=267408 RepID=UPI00257B32DB|nr:MULTISPECIES: transcription antitermination factor NusB [Arsenicicoccus]
MTTPDERRPGRPESPARPGGRRGPRQKSAQRPSERARSGDPARLTAYTVLRSVAEGGYANLELPRLLRDHGMAGRDAAFATELTYGTLRWQGLYDPVIADASGRSVDKIDPPVLDTLRLGAHQVLGMRVPAHAAVAETVGLARQVNGAGAAGFVNAVLRRVSERSRQEWLDRVLPAGTGVDRLAMEHSHPEWIVRALRAALLAHGAGTVETVDQELVSLLEADNDPADVMLVARPGLVEVADLVRLGAEPAPVSPVGAVLRSGDPGALAPVRDGRAAVQDEGSQVLALALAAVPVESSDDYPEEWLDLCAGPGGKAGLLAALSVGRAYLTANEVSPHRADLVRQGLRAAIGAGAGVEVRVGDGRDTGVDEPGRYDRVLVDAPCTGLGALRRRPEARWRRTTADLAALTELQRELLASAIEATRPGGVIAYATCSPHVNETTFVVQDVAGRRDDVEVLDAHAVLREVAPGLEVAGEGPHAQLWPHRNETDGMFLALLRKR